MLGRSAGNGDGWNAEVHRAVAGGAAIELGEFVDGSA